MAGSAVGLENAWKSPALVDQDGGSAFALLYLALILGVAFVVFLTKLSMGKLSGKDPVNGYRTLALNNKKTWSMAGFIILGTILIVSFYSLVIGWVIKYMYLSMNGNLSLILEENEKQFNQLLHHGFIGQFVYFSIIFLIAFYVVSKGVKNRIGKLNVWVTPTLFILLILMLFYALSHTNDLNGAL